MQQHRFFLSAWVAATLIFGRLVPSPAAHAQHSLVVQGTVLAPSDHPIEGAQVELIALQGRWLRDRESLEGRIRGEPASTSETNNHGEFRLVAPRAGYWRVVVEATGFLPAQNALAPLIGSKTLGPVHLQPADMVSIEVMNREGRPISGAWVRVGWSRFAGPSMKHGPLDGWTATSRDRLTDSSGRARVPRIADETLSLFAWAPGFVEPQPERVDASKVLIELSPGVRRNLRVRTAAGEPAGDVLVRVGEAGWPLALSAEDGSVSVVIAPERSTRVDVEDASGASFFVSLVPEDDTQANSTIQLEPFAQIEGRVVARDTGRGIAGAWVVLSNQYPRYVRADERGAFSIRGRLSGKGFLGVAAGGYRSETQTVLLGETHTSIELEPVARLTGIAVDEGGHPVVGVRIQARPKVDSREQLKYFRQDSARRGESDSEGHFQIGELRPQVAYVLEGIGEGFAHSRVEVLDPSKERGPVRLVMRRGATAWGRVVDGSGNTIAEATVELVSAPEVNSMSRFFAFRIEIWEPFSVVSDPKGRAVWQHLPSGSYSLTAKAPGFAQSSQRTVEMAEGEDSDLGDIELPVGIQVRGRVVDPDGKALGEAVISVSKTEQLGRSLGRSENIPDLVTESDGRFTLVDRRSGEKLKLEVSKTGFSKKELPGVEVLSTEESLKIVLQPAQRVSGMVVGADGEGIDYAQVLLAKPAGSGLATGFLGSASADSEGRFVLEDVSPGPIRLEISASGWQERILGDLEVVQEEDLEGLRIVLERGYEIEGRVLEADGSPASEVMVTISKQGLPGVSFSASRYARTDANGSYLIAGMAQGYATVVARKDDGTSTAEEIEVQPGSNRLDLRFEGGVEISGQVVTDDGESVAGALVYLQSNDRQRGKRIEARVDQEGHFRFEEVAAASYRFFFDHPTYAISSPGDSLVVAGAPIAGVTLSLVHGGSISGRIVGLEPSETRRVVVGAYSQMSGAHSSGRVESDGSYIIGRLAPGDWSITAQKDAGQAGEEISLAAGEDLTGVDLVFGSGFTLTGVVMKDSEPLSGVHLGVEGLDASSVGGATTDHRGRFEIDRLEPGRYRLSIYQMGSGGTFGKEIVLEGDRDMVIEIETFELAGRILDEHDSAPIEGVVMRLESLAGDQVAYRSLGSGATSDSDGYFRLIGIPVGDYRVVVEKDGYAALELTLEGGSHEEMEIALRPTQGVRLEVLLPSGVRASEVSASVMTSLETELVGRAFQTISQGRLRLGSVPPGDWRILLQSADSAVTAVEISVPSALVAVQLQRGTRVQVRVMALDGDPAGLATVRLIGDDGRSFRSLGYVVRDEWPTLRGRTTIDHVPPGAWTVLAETPDGRSWQRRIQLTGGAALEVDLP